MARINIKKLLPSLLPKTAEVSIVEIADQFAGFLSDDQACFFNRIGRQFQGCDNFREIERKRGENVFDSRFKAEFQLWYVIRDLNHNGRDFFLDVAEMIKTEETREEEQ